MISVKNLTRQFDKRGIAGLHSLSFSVKKGEILAIIGPNGSGKSTLLNLLSGTMKPDAGEILAEGKATLFSSVEELPDMNVQKWLKEAVSLDIDDEKKIQLTRDLADTFEFTFQLRQNLKDLSAGQKQKIILAKHLINKPSLLMLDEPFAHLDPFTRVDILKNLFQYLRHQEISLIWVTHDLDEAFRFSDVIGVMNFGKIEQWGTPLSIVQRPQNLFVAQYLGYRNFFTSKKTQQGFETPWGTFPSDIEGENALFVVPDHAWEQSPEGVSFEVINVSPVKQEIQFELEWSERSFFMIRPSQSKLLPVNKKVTLKPRTEDCFFIRL